QDNVIHAVVHHHQVRREIAKLDGYFDRSLGIAMARQPEPHGDDQGECLQTKIAARQGDNLLPQLFHGLTRSCNVERSRAPSMFSVTLPPTTSDTVLSCSEITTAMASVSSVTPSAARWRVPQVLRRLGLVLSGRRQRTAVTRPF